MTAEIENNAPVTPEPEMVKMSVELTAAQRTDIRVLCAKRGMTIQQFMFTATNLYLAELLRIQAAEEKAASVRYPNPNHPFHTHKPII